MQIEDFLWHRYIVILNHNQILTYYWTEHYKNILYKPWNLAEAKWKEFLIENEIRKVSDQKLSEIIKTEKLLPLISCPTLYSISSKQKVQHKIIRAQATQRNSLKHEQNGHHDDVIKWKHFPHHWPFVRGIHQSPVNSPHKGQWRGALMLSLICA